MKKTIAVILAVILIAGGILVPKYNKLVRLDNEVDSSFAQVQVVIKRRADLIPNLVETVKGYSIHEKSTFLEVTEARNKVQKATTPKELAQADGELSKAVGSLNLVVENYPELKANENFLSLQAQIEGTENRISTERERYNDKIKEYNLVVKSFPMNIFAKMLGFNQKEYFEASPSEQEAPTVKF